MISILVPTRGRPARFEEMTKSVWTSVEELNQVEIVAYLQDDDILAPSYRDTHGLTKFVHGPRLVMSDMWNALLPHAAGDILQQSADDVIYRTLGWDLKVEEAFAACPDKILMCYGDDLGPNGKNFATLPFVSRRWVDTVGYFTGPGFSADYSDTWVNDVAGMISRKKFLPIEIEHCHHLWGKAPLDQTYKENAERMAKDRPDLKYTATLADRVKDCEKLRAVMDHSWRVQS